ncbi:MAG: hypothetical protein ABWK53_02150 [Anaerolineales bacterium]
MLTFFRQAEESQLIGSPAYLESILQTYQNDRLSGLIQVSAAADWEIVILFEHGTRVRSYRLEPQTCRLLSGEDLGADWSAREAPIRTLVLPDAAVWAVWLALECYPPAGQETKEARMLSDYFAARQAEKKNCLVQLMAEESDGFVLLWEGEPARADVVFSTANGFSNSLPFNRLRDENATAPWGLQIYDINPQLPVFSRLRLRAEVSAWVRATFHQYQDLVGMRLLASLIHNINQASQSQQWRIGVDSAGLVDRHIFAKVETCQMAYRAILQSMQQQISLVIGNLLTQRLLTETFEKLTPAQQQSLAAQALTPAVLNR